MSGVLNVRVTEDLVLDGGTWELIESQEGQPVARIAPPATPMFRQVVEYLETKPVPQGGNLRRDGEARAAVAVCLRWGSYFALLADPTRWADGYELGARRMLPAAEKAIICQAQSGLYAGLKVVDILKYVAGWPPPAERLLPFLHPVIAPSRWSYTEQSRAVELPLRRGVQDSQAVIGGRQSQAVAGPAAPKPDHKLGCLAALLPKVLF